MAVYLDPKADLTFKKVFGEHKELMISFLNAMLPLPDNGQVEWIEYLEPELIPDHPLKKDTIVDVRCKDVRGRQFLVEMQMIWTPAFMKRVLLNATKAYSRQLDKGGHYEDIQPVYSLNLVNDTFRDDTEDYYHDYGIMDIKNPDQTIDEMHLIFIELPKFKPHSFHDKKMMVLWLRYLTEINEKTRQAPAELLENPDTCKALDIVKESAFTEAQMAGYEHFWDAVSTERTLVGAVERANKNLQQALDKVDEVQTKLREAQANAERVQADAERAQNDAKRAKADAKRAQADARRAKAEGEKAKALDTARKMIADGMNVETAAKYTGLTEAEIKSFLQ